MMIQEGDVEGFREAIRDLELMELRGPGGDTVLHIAASAGQSELMTRIILPEYNDLITTKNSKGELPLHVAARAGELDSVKCLVDWIEEQSRRGEGQGDVRIEMDVEDDTASSQNQEEQGDELGGVRIEMDLIAEVNGEGDTALHIALKNHNEEMAAYLVDKYPSASYYANRSRVSPLYLAIKEGYSQLVHSMLDKKPIGDEDVKNRLLQAKSVVHAAILVRKADLLAIILNGQPALMDTYDEKGTTPLAYAAFIGCLHAIRFFFDKFPNYVYKVDKHGSFPIHEAARGGHVRVLKEFLSRFPRMKNLLNLQGQSILHIASSGGKADTVSYLLKMQGIDRSINLRDEDGNTSLHLAIVGGHLKVVRTLSLDERVDLSLQNKRGMNALDEAESFEGTLPTYEQGLIWMVLRYANASRARCEFDFWEALKHENPKTPNLDKFNKDRVNTTLLVSTLVATVTFAAGFTVPGGYSSSGMAIFAHKPAFQAFVITNTIALYSSIFAVVALICAQLGNLRLILVFLESAIVFLMISLSMMSMTFMFGVYLMVNHVHWLSIVIVVTGSIFLLYFILLLLPLPPPSSHPSIWGRWQLWVSSVLWR